jgi:hypothetical protein
MYAPRSRCGSFGLLLGTMLSLCMRAYGDESGSSTVRQPAVVAAAALSPKSVLHTKKARRRSSMRRSLELTLPRLSFSSAAPPFVTQGLPPPLLLEPYEPARFHRFGPSPFQPVTSIGAAQRTARTKDEPFLIGFSQDWNLQWDLLQDASPAAGHRFGLNIGLQRKF